MDKVSIPPAATRCETRHELEILVGSANNNGAQIIDPRILYADCVIG